MYSFILLAGGVNSRMKQDISKQYMLLAGKTVLMHTIERIDKIDEIREIIIVCAPDYRNMIESMLSQYAIKTYVKFANAGGTRQKSVKSGLEQAEFEYVLLHEAARPFVSEEDFRQLIKELSSNAMYGTAIPFTVLKGKDHIDLADPKQIPCVMEEIIKNHPRITCLLNIAGYTNPQPLLTTTLESFEYTI